MRFEKIIVSLLLLWTINTCWAESPQSFCKNAETSNIESSSDLKSVSGEIISITSSQVVINHFGICLTFHFAQGIYFSCNEKAASWRSLRPITNRSFFEAQAFLNQQNEVIFLKGNYKGEECIIDGWLEEQKKLTLSLTSVNDGFDKNVGVDENARKPNEKWLIIGQLVFVLYNYEGQIRAIYLPD